MRLVTRSSVLLAAALALVAALVLLLSHHDSGASSGRAALAPAASAGDVTIWAVGDADGGRASRAVTARIAADRPARVLYLGDVYPDGSRRDFRAFDRAFARIARITAPTPGNHDWNSRNEGYLPYWRAKTGSAPAPWYALRAGGWRILSLNSEAAHGDDSPQLRWLRAELARTRGTCALAFWHRPLESAGPHGDNEDVAPLWDALRGHAVLVVNGHDHDMQRLRPRDGMVAYVSGAGGRSHYAVDASDERVVFSDDERDGALRIRLRRGSATLELVAAGGAVVDRSSVRCAPAHG